MWKQEVHSSEDCERTAAVGVRVCSLRVGMLTGQFAMAFVVP